MFKFESIKPINQNKTLIYECKKINCEVCRRFERKCGVNPDMDLLTK
jgi:hypothetical protein